MNFRRRVVRSVCIAGWLAASSWPGAAMAAEPAKVVCTVEEVKADVAKSQPKVMSALQGMVSSTRCSSLVNLLRLLANNKVVAGRKLEPGRAAEPGEAERELAEARADPAIQAALAAELEGETDEARKLFLEAVVMADKRKLLARNLLLERLVTGGRP